MNKKTATLLGALLGLLILFCLIALSGAIMTFVFNYGVLLLFPGMKPISLLNGIAITLGVMLLGGLIESVRK